MGAGPKQVLTTKIASPLWHPLHLLARRKAPLPLAHKRKQGKPPGHHPHAFAANSQSLLPFQRLRCSQSHPHVRHKTHKQPHSIQPKHTSPQPSPLRTRHASCIRQGVCGGPCFAEALRLQPKPVFGMSMMENNQEKPSRGKCLHLLVVDDDPALLELMVALLGQKYLVSGFDDPLLALAALEAGAEFDGVVSDLCMNSLSGKELFEHLQTRQPSLAERFVLVTGGASDSEGHRFIQSLGPRVLRKPFNASLLLAHVQLWLNPPL